jgi:hypothetical protein
MNIDLTGWTRVQTWRESHGEHVEVTYQKEHTGMWTRRVECLVISTYRDGRTSGVRTESAHDYLLARDIRADSTRYQPLDNREVAPCCTAGHEEFRDMESDRLYRVFGAAGHGEWAFEIKPED